MLGEYFSNLEKEVNNISHLMKKNDEMARHLDGDRRDINDLHTILMLREASKKIPKKNRLVFIGTGQINENVVHAYLHFHKAIESKKIKFDGETLFIARSELEYQLITAFGFPCEVWHYQPLLTRYLLETKAVVFSSHLYSNWGDCLLTHCIADAIKIELWHGLPAKTIGAACITNELEFHFFSRLLYDSVNTDYVCIQNDKDDVKKAYSDCFPYAKQYVTGDVRTDILFNQSFREEYLKNKSSKLTKEWLDRNPDKFKLLYCPTYRETPSSIEIHYKKMLDLLKGIDNSQLLIAVKLHVGIVLTNEQKQELDQVCREKGFLFIDNFDEVYSVFNDFDGMIVDYSSIRSDFALTGKPIFLWRFDQNTYHRTTDIVAAFGKLDKVSYELGQNIESTLLLECLRKDPLASQRKEVVEKELAEFSNGSSAERTIRVFLDVMESA